MAADHGRLVAAALVAEAVLAGGNAVAIRFSNRELAPLWGAGLRFSLAAIPLLVLVVGMKLALPRGRALIGVLVWGLLQFSGAFGLYYYALVQLRAGLGQTLLALVPLATLLLAVLQRQERLRGTALLGTVLGLVGVALVSRDPLRESVSLPYVLAVLGSVLCFAEAALLVRRLRFVHPVAMNAVGMTVGAAVLFAASVLMAEPHALPERAATWFALGYVALVGSVVVFLLHVFVLQRWPASRAAYVMVMVPFVTVLLSAWLDNEAVGAGLVLGGLLILSGVFLGALRPERASLNALEPASLTSKAQDVGRGPAA